MPAEYLQYTVPEGTAKVRIRYNAETNKIEAEMIPKDVTEPPPDETTSSGEVTVTDHVTSFFTGKGKGAFANPDED